MFPSGTSGRLLEELQIRPIGPLGNSISASLMIHF